MIARRIDWEQRLIAYLHSVRKLPLVYGQHDCCLHTCAVIEALTGVDVATPFRGRYNCRLSALKVMREVTGSSTLRGLADFIARQHEIPQHEDPILAARGDPVLYRYDGQEPLLAIAYGSIVLAVGTNGLYRVPLHSAVAAWRI